jgi:hypothetical protein
MPVGPVNSKTWGRLPPRTALARRCLISRCPVKGGKGMAKGKGWGEKSHQNHCNMFFNNGLGTYSQCALLRKVRTATPRYDK